MTFIARSSPASLVVRLILVVILLIVIGYRGGCFNRFLGEDATPVAVERRN